MADKQFVSDKPLTFGCDFNFDLGHGKLNCVRDTTSHFYLSVKLD